MSNAVAMVRTLEDSPKCFDKMPVRRLIPDRTPENFVKATGIPSENLNLRPSLETTA